MAKIIDVAGYILRRKGTLSVWQLHKLCFYAQAWTLAWCEDDNITPLFDENFIAGINGPISQDLANIVGKKLTIEPGVIPFSPEKLTDDEKSNIRTILEDYGKLTPYALQELVQSEGPWVLTRDELVENTRADNVISKSKMRKYYRALFLTGNSPGCENRPKNIIELKERYKRGEAFDIQLFYGHEFSQFEITDQCLSQWYPSKFMLDDTMYSNAEQYMMHQKAILFKDKDTAARILLTEDPREAKKLGRIVKNFDEKMWNEYKYTIIVRGNNAKFSQNTVLAKFLLNTGEKILAEASPYDKIWGTGFAAQHPSALVPSAWVGENLLGFALMEVRDYLKLII